MAKHMYLHVSVFLGVKGRPFFLFCFVRPECCHSCFSPQAIISCCLMRAAPQDINRVNDYRSHNMVRIFVKKLFLILVVTLKKMCYSLPFCYLLNNHQKILINVKWFLRSPQRDMEPHYINAAQMLAGYN